ncbi:hypothetical protein [Aliikangiella sp. IMCC44359]|uniref:hypothetical protein n=1 Tax=Aliikangiella sp. IMCC44359 TaxID=3459125 RepID=UPI00403A9526
MITSKSISSEPPENKGLDYAWLKEKGIDIIQELSGGIWTDYNEHDPGVTTLEQLCYALTELSYRAEFPLKNLLMEPGADEINQNKQALYKPEAIFPCNPVTQNDYRKLILDRISAIKNIWFLSPCKQSKSLINGLYQVLIYAPNVDECDCDGSQSVTEIKQQVIQLYSAHRNLCEDIGELIFLEEIPTEVFAKVSINSLQNANTILAQLYFQIAILLAPEVKRYSLQEALDRGASTGEVFNGPLLFNGLINDESLKKKILCIEVSEIISKMLVVEGVINVQNLKVCLTINNKIHCYQDKVDIAPENYLKLMTGLANNHCQLPIKLYCNGIEANINSIVVERELKRLYRVYRRTYNLNAEYLQTYKITGATYIDLTRYYSIQNQYPDVYGINQYGVADTESNARKAQAKQLKGYLLVFDQIMANYFSQLANARQLYSTELNLTQTYFYQYLDRYVPNIEPLLKKGGGINGYHSGLPIIIKEQDPYVKRRNRFLSFLLAMYGQQIEPIYVRSEQCVNYDLHLLKAQLGWLRHLTSGTHNRGKGFDYLGPISKKNMAGMQIKTRIQLGIEENFNRPFEQHCTELGVEIVENNEDATLGRLMNVYSEDIYDNEYTDLSQNMNEKAFVEQQISNSEDLSINGEKLSEGFIDAASRYENYQLRTRENNSEIILVCQSSKSNNNDCFFIGQYKNYQQAQKNAFELVEKIQSLYTCGHQLYLVEHLLLRFGIEGSSEDISMQPIQTESEQLGDISEQAACFNYSFSMTVVISASQSQLNDLAYREMVIEIVQQNTPAHILNSYCFLNLYQIRYFERIYWKWRHALKNNDQTLILKISRRLRRFLSEHTFNDNTVTPD